MTVESDHIQASDLGPGPWWIAHDYPERDVDNWTVWSWHCDACMMHMVAAVARHGSRAATVETPEDGTRWMDVASALACARTWRAERGMRAL